MFFCHAEKDANIVYFSFFADIEAQIQEIQNKKKELAQTQNDKGVSLLESGYFDSDLYDDGANKRNRYEGYMTSIAANDDIDDDDDDGLPITQKRTTYTAPKAVLKDVVQQVSSHLVHSLPCYQFLIEISSFVSVQSEKEDYDPFADRRRPTIAEKEDEYRQKRRRLVISPERADPFADGLYYFLNNSLLRLRLALV